MSASVQWPRRAAGCIAIGAMLALPARADSSDPVVLSFAFVGCNRLDRAGVDATGSESSANVVQLLQTVRDVASTRPAPQFLILAGDIVKAKKAGTKRLAKELAAWRDLVGRDAARVPKLVVFTGNHELLMSDQEGEEAVEVPNPPAYGYWQATMGAYIAGHDGPRAGGPDQLLDDESALSYTFRSGDTLFVVVNTDSLLDARTIGAVPTQWLAGRLREAQRDATVRHVFVMGHKPLALPGRPAGDGDATVRGDAARAVYALLNQPDPLAPTTPTKVRAYLAAHAHRWDYFPDLKFAFGAGRVAQIVAGNGGSPPEAAWAGANGYFGYTLMTVRASGAVTAQSFGRAIPQPYSLPTAAAPATVRSPAYSLVP